MDNLDLIKQFLLRKQYLLSLIKPIVLILLLNETKKELDIAIYKRNYFRLKKNALIPDGDNYERKLAAFFKDHYESNIEETQKIINELKLLVDKLNVCLNFHNNDPIKEEKTAYDRRPQIDFMFELILRKDSYFQGKCFDILKNLVFGELVRISNIKSEQREYLSLIYNFRENCERWKQSWINDELPDEGLF